MPSGITLAHPRDVTSYDLLKALALVLMLIDHVGVHFYPDEIWFRVLGRLCVPIWFFLIGYARTDEIPRRLWLAALIVLFSALAAGQVLLPLNILFTIILARFLRRRIVKRAFRDFEMLRGVFLILAFASMPTGYAFEYGALGILFMLLGYICRNREEISKTIPRFQILLFWFGSFMVFWLLQGGLHSSMNGPKLAALTLGLVLVGGVLWFFRPQRYPMLTSTLTPLLAVPLKILGRKTLEIYVLHIVIFRAVSTYIYPDRFPAFDLKIIAPDVLAIVL